jgi:hypothetical protein
MISFFKALEAFGGKTYLQSKCTYSHKHMHIHINVYMHIYICPNLLIPSTNP